MQSSYQQFIAFLVTGNFGPIQSSTSEAEILTVIPTLSSYYDAPWSFLTEEDLEFTFDNHKLFMIRVKFDYPFSYQSWAEPLGIHWYTLVKEYTLHDLRELFHNAHIAYDIYYFDDDSTSLEPNNAPIAFVHREDQRIDSFRVFYTGRTKWNRNSTIIRKVERFGSI